MTMVGFLWQSIKRKFSGFHWVNGSINANSERGGGARCSKRPTDKTPGAPSQRSISPPPDSLVFELWVLHLSVLSPRVFEPTRITMPAPSQVGCDLFDHLSSLLSKGFSAPLAIGATWSPPNCCLDDFFLTPISFFQTKQSKIMAEQLC